MTKEIPLTRGKVSLVDDEDYGRLSQLKWFAQESGRTWYACRGRGGSFINMHRYILNAKPDMQVDHRNGNGLDNRRSNLRPANHSENKCNGEKYSNNTSGFKGVCWDKKSGRWRARIRFHGHLIHIGYFYHPIDAARAYDDRAGELHGDFARTNF